jgi:hypothetical protein
MGKMKTKNNHDYVQTFCNKFGYSIKMQGDNFKRIQEQERFKICINYEGVSTTPQFRDNLYEYFKNQAASNGGVRDTFGHIVVDNQLAHCGVENLLKKNRY